MTTALEERVEIVEDQTDSLESILATFMATANNAIMSLFATTDRLEATTDRLERSETEFRREMLEFKNWARASIARQEKSQEESRRNTEAFQKEMKDFKDEMNSYRQRAEADRKQMNKQWGELANKMGTIVEDIVAPNIPRIAKEHFQVRELDFLAIRVRKRSSRNKSRRREFDVIAASDEHLFVNETKATPRPEYVRDFIRMLPEIRDYFPEYGDRKLIPIFSSLQIPDDLVAYLSKNKIYAMAMGDETMVLLNFDAVDERE